jgi:anti-anti-sigma regulatory factor
MDVRLLEPNVLFALLPSEPLLQPELRLLGMQLTEREAAHLILDMSRVEIVTSPSIGGLLLLRQLQSDRGMRLVLCNVRLATKCILRVVGLDTIFTCVRDRPEALKTLGLRSRWNAGSSGANVAEVAAASQV